MTENNAAQPGLTDDEINNLCGWRASNTTMRAENDRALARAVASALLSKLRAEGVQAGDEVEWAGYRPLLRDAIAAKDAMHEAGIQYATFGVMFPEMMRRYAAALASAPVAKPNRAPVDDGICWSSKEIQRRQKEEDDARAAYYHSRASAPVAGEAHPAITLKAVDEYGPQLDWTKHWVEYPIGTKFYAAPQASEAVRTPDYTLQHADHMAVSAERLMEAVNNRDAVIMQREESDDVDDDTLWDQHETVSEYLRGMREAIYEYRKRRLRAAPSPTPSVVKQSLTATQTGEKGEKDAQ